MIPVLAIGVAMAATPPCIVPFESAPRLFAPRAGLVIPANGRVVAIDPEGAITLVDGNAQTVDVDVSSIDVDVGFADPFQLRVLTPKNFVTGALIVEKNGEFTSELLAEGVNDLEPPPPPTATVIGPYTDGACPPYVELDVEPDDDVAFVIATVDGDDDVIDGLSIDRQLIVAGPADETRSVTLRSVDLVGHLSEPVSIEVTFPSEIGSPGCLCTGSSLVDVSAASLLLLARRRRRR